jgi:hypothetical protein
MSRPRKLTGDRRDGFVNYRIDPETSARLNALCFLLETSGGEIVRDAIKAYLDRFKTAIDKLMEAKASIFTEAQP